MHTTKDQRLKIQISSKGKTIMSEKEIGERCNEDICKRLIKIATNYYWISLNFILNLNGIFK